METYRIDQTLRVELEQSLAQMSQTLANRDAALLNLRKELQTTQEEKVSLQTVNQELEERNQQVMSRFEKLRQMLSLEEESTVMRIVDIIRKKESGDTLTGKEVRFLVEGFGKTLYPTTKWLLLRWRYTFPGWRMKSSPLGPKQCFFPVTASTFSCVESESRQTQYRRRWGQN